ncbi:ATP-dependent zinc metalloprotease FtsH [Companilactobacillus sp. RD055328]|uniref:ATP-dependent zinc metalloprotease FtsH n=1 Tax=Companilactobacillus sp. RD055328 TaxID=2916634 RepID=UPI001FC7FC20|nr:ATP-dependent zinc metalloprotease FtsH [Companilactobacillus sp. RD055328]GKQ42283.1 ATP-dependent zinc metalloprotease FtsH [Companilactobacillus sp. RD055328]
MKNNRNRLVNNSLFYILVFVVLILGLSWLVGGQSGSQTKTLNSTEFISKLEKNKVKEFSIQPSNGTYHIEGELKSTKKDKKDSKKSTNAIPFLSSSQSASSESTHFMTSVLTNDATLKQINDIANKNNVDVKAQEESQTGAWLNIALLVIPTIVVFFFLYMMMGQSGGQGGGGGAGRMMNFGKTQVKPQDPKKNKVRFSDVAGAEEEKQELVEVVEFLKDPRKYLELGARIPAGVLLEGPPGTGKTLLAKAVAGEAGVPFFSISGSDFVEMFVGVGASRVRDLFETAKKNSPSIIFIDEIDAVARQRGNGMGGGNDEREQTLNQLLVEMDGFTGSEGVIVIAATNRSDVLDPALLRAGRFDRKVLVGRPDVKGREAILKVHSNNKPLSEDVDLKVVAQQTPGFVGADLENLLNEAALVAARREKKKIDNLDIDEATDRVIAGPAKKDKAISKKERNVVAYHEAGHALIGLVLSDSRVVRKVTIVPRGRAGGYAIMLPKDENFLATKKELDEQIAGLLGGRTAEEIIFGALSSGASNDFEQATAIARSMVTQYGMSEKLGTVQLEREGQQQYGQPMYSQQTAKEIDDEVRDIINIQHKRANEIIESHREQHKAIAEALLKYETLNEAEILSLYNTGEMPEKSKDEFPSETAATFDEAKAAMEIKDAKRQAEEVSTDKKVETPSEADNKKEDPKSETENKD